MPAKDTTLPRTLLRGGKLVLPDRLATMDLLIENGRIARIEPELVARQGDRIIQADGQYILPGFIDIHNHGARGFDFSLGVYQPDDQTFRHSAEAFPEAFNTALQYYLQKGATRVLPTSLAAPLEELEFAFQQLDQFTSNKSHPLAGMVEGINLEGTFLKLPAFAGAQNPEYFYPPDPEVFQRLQEASGGRIRIVNLPPEHGKNGLALTRELRSRGVVVAGGHTGAEADTFDEAIEAGLELGVHFLNGPSRSSSKAFRGGGAEEAMLRSDAVSLELIVDGYHVHPAYVRDVIARKEPERVILITDSMFVNGCKDIETFRLLNIPGRVSSGGDYLQVLNKKDTLFGSVLTPDRGFENVLNWLTTSMPGVWHRKHPAIPLQDALVMTSGMASLHPARLLGIDDETGTLETGKVADLIIASLSKRETKWSFCVRKTFLQGKMRHEKV